ncbi:MAG: hypothetical protein ACI8QS_000476 [Planctomycetota bacterium]|jgi:hypothetical protein
MALIHIATLSATLSLFSAPAPGPVSAVDLELGEVLSHAREPAHRPAWDELENGLTLIGDGLIQMLETPFEITFAPTGAFRLSSQGPLGNTSGWDGETFWSRTAEGPTAELHLEAKNQQLLGQWVHSGYWVDAGPAIELELIGETEQRITLGIGVADAESDSRLVLDAGSWLPMELIQSRISYDLTTTFSDYRMVAGVPIAHRLTTTGSPVEGHLQINSASPATPDPGDRFHMSTASPKDTRFTEDTPSAIEIRRVRSGHLIVHPLVNGDDLGWFILDTGAGRLCIDPGAADKLDLPKFGAVAAVGVSGAVTANYRRASTLSLGPVELSNPVFVEIDLAFLEQHFGVPVSGICGYDLFARTVFELDLQGPNAAIHDPSTFELEGDVWTDLVLTDNLPSIQCRFEGDQVGLFRIDTGDSGTVHFHSPAVKRLELLKDRRVTGHAQVGGVGGMSTVTVAELEWFTLGGRRYEEVSALFSDSEIGAHSSQQTMGTLGSKLFEPFIILFDYQGQRIALIPRGE